ncbi:hypothetical protein HPB50_023226 [Hyalomma asiaticum]|uniref:Uncharacterized protein n=1 Tax=Hyalomma asiaticum TaxID=266040 RepID=A0ACB7SQA9_HYAAI|nr:hypothetical protein HPB50_023226 [Hyalomma asiaticum]
MLRISAFSFRSRFSSARPCSGAVAPVTFPPGLPPLHARSAQVPPCPAGSCWLRKRTFPCGSLDRLLERDRPLDWDRRRLLDRDLGRPSEEAPSFLPRERLLDRDLDLERLFGRCDESRPSCRASAERLLERERACVDWVRRTSALAGVTVTTASTTPLERLTDVSAATLHHVQSRPQHARKKGRSAGDPSK